MLFIIYRVWIAKKSISYGTGQCSGRRLYFHKSDVDDKSNDTALTRHAEEMDHEIGGVRYVK